MYAMHPVLRANCCSITTFCSASEISAPGLNWQVGLDEA